MIFILKAINFLYNLIYKKLRNFTTRALIFLKDIQNQNHQTYLFCQFLINVLTCDLIHVKYKLWMLLCKLTTASRNFCAGKYFMDMSREIARWP